MKTIFYIALVLITTSCSTINYCGNGKLKKVKVDRTNQISLYTDKDVEHHDILLRNNSTLEIQDLNPVLLNEIPNKSSKACFQRPQYLKEKKNDASAHNRNLRLSQKRIKTASTTNKNASRNGQQETSKNRQLDSGLDGIDNPLIRTLIIIAAILILAILITLIVQGLMYNPQLTGIIIGIVVLIGLIVVVIINGELSF